MCWRRTIYYNPPYQKPHRVCNVHDEVFGISWLPYEDRLHVDKCTLSLLPVIDVSYSSDTPITIVVCPTIMPYYRFEPHS